MKRKFARIVIYMEISYTNTKMIGIADFVFDFIGNSDGFPMKQKGCASAFHFGRCRTEVHWTSCTSHV